MFLLAAALTASWMPARRPGGPVTPPSVRAAVLALSLLAITAVARPAAAQTTRAGDGCTFERCGLRVQ